MRYIGLFVFFAYLFIPTDIFAQLPTCVLESPKEVRSSDPSATFVINVGDNQQKDVNQNPTVTAWRIQSVCSWGGSPLGNSTYSAAVQGPDKITATVSGGGCEFDPRNGTIEIKVQAVTGGSAKDWCSVRYNVVNANNLCKLSISPETGITPTTKLIVSGTDVSSEGSFVLFFDGSPMNLDGVTARLPGVRDVPSPSFTDKEVPNALLTLGNHRISIRQRRPPDRISAPVIGGPSLVDPRIDSYFHPPACFVDFSVGTQQNPGSKKGEGNTGTPGTENIAAKCTGGNCSRSAGQTCTFKGGDGILTAIGCVPYEPVAFAQGILSFVISMAGGIALVIMIYGAYEMVTSSGNPDTLKKGQERFTGAILGLLFIVFSVLLLKIIGVDILDIPFLN